MEFGVQKSFLKNAFTLAEVIIVIGIIGIIAEMTLPTLISDIQHQELKSQFQKTYSKLSEATRYVVANEYGGVAPIPNPLAAGSTFIEFTTSYQKYFIKSVKCDYTDNNCSTNVFPVSINYADTSVGVSSFTQTNYKSFSGGATHTPLYDDAMVALADGAFLYFDWGNNLGNYLITADVNGWKKKPNRFGYDVFMFQIASNGVLLPMGAQGTIFASSAYCSKTSTDNRNGFGCASHALSDEDYFSKLGK